MAKKFKKLSDKELSVKLDGHIKGGVKHFDTVLSKERQEVLDYYHGKLPKPAHSGNSKYVSMDVWDAVESAKATLLETFAAGSEIAEFTPQGEDDVEPARIASEYTDYVLFRQNDGYGLFSTVIQDGLLSRVGIAKVYWDKKFEKDEEEFEGTTLDDLDLLLAEEDVELKGEPEFDPDTQTLKGTITRKRDCSQVRVEPVPPEEFIISQTAKSLRDETFCAHRVQKTVADLLAMGLTPEEAAAVPSDEDSVLTNSDKYARFEKLADELKSDKEDQEQMRKVTVYECYAKLDIEGTGEPRLWKITKVGEHILDKEPITRVPFVPYVPLPIPHAFYGSNYATKVIPIQNARTVLMRGILDHTVITNNPRMMVVKGALVNPREMLENRIGGLVNVTRPDGLAPVPQASLNPFVFQTIQLLDEDKEDTTGVSKLSQGLNKDAVSKQNSQGMVEQLVGLSQQRQKIIARNFANHFVIPLFLEIYQLVIENESQKKVFEVSGNWVEVDPYDWSERKDVSVKLKLGYGEREREAQKWLGLHQFLSQDPAIQGMYDIKGKHKVISNYLKLNDVKNISDYLLPPEQVPPPQPPPDLVASVEKMKAETEAIMAKSQLAQAQFEFKSAMEKMQLQLEKSNKMIELMTEQREQERKEFDSKSRHDTAQRELTLLENTKPTETKQTQIISPNG